MITKEKATDIAIEHIRKNIHNLISVDKVCDVFELRGGAPIIYSTPVNDRCWFVYLNNHFAGYGLKSSDIIIVSKDTGKVLYFGSANDEG